MNPEKKINDKLDRVKKSLSGMENIAVAYSGGVDSTLLLKIAYDIRGDKVIGIYADSPLQPDRERIHALEVARSIGAKVYVINSNHLLREETFRMNPRNRCYFCKGFIFNGIISKAKELGYTSILDGSNFDDTSDFRPGRKALIERNIHSPLQEAGLTKEEIRSISKRYGLPTWEKEAYACLASRIPYGMEITLEKLKQVDEVEQILIRRGYHNVRARHYGERIRVEVKENQVMQLREEIEKQELTTAILSKGFKTIGIDPDGYRQGSLNDRKTII